MLRSISLRRSGKLLTVKENNGDVPFKSWTMTNAFGEFKVFGMTVESEGMPHIYYRLYD